MPADNFDEKTEPIILSTPTVPTKCDIIIDGRIDATTLDGFRSAYETLRGHNKKHNKYLFLCLTSGGGDIGAGISIAKEIRAAGFPPNVTSSRAVQDRFLPIVTVVREGDTCVSSCAIIFMAGGYAVFPLRYLHPRGRLVFHSPFVSPIELQKATQNAKRAELLDLISGLYEIGLRDMREIIGVFNSSADSDGKLLPPWVRPSLFLEAFARNPSELLCVDTIDRIGRWNVSLFGYKPPKEPTRTMIYHACENTYSWQQDSYSGPPRSSTPEEQDIFSIFFPRPSTPAEEDIPIFRPPPAQKIGDRNTYLNGFDRRYVLTWNKNFAQCVVEMTGDEKINVFFADEMDRRRSDIFSVSPTVFFAPDTITDSIADPAVLATPAHRSNGPNAQPNFTPYMNSSIPGCTYRKINTVDAQTCEANCKSDPTTCKAYSFNKVSHACELKHTLSARLKDPLWTTGAPSRFALEVTNRRNFVAPEGVGKQLHGSTIPPLTNISLEQCSSQCEQKQTCLGYSFYGDPKETGRCEMFLDIVNITDPTDRKIRVTSGIKRQW